MDLRGAGPGAPRRLSLLKILLPLALTCAARWGEKLVHTTVIRQVARRAWMKLRAAIL